MSIYKEHILSPINNRRASCNFVEHIEGHNINYTQNSNKTQAVLVTAFPSSIQKSILIYMPDNDDKRVVIYWIATNFIRNKLQSDTEINLDNIITDYQIISA